MARLDHKSSSFRHNFSLEEVLLMLDLYVLKVAEQCPQSKYLFKKFGFKSFR